MRSVFGGLSSVCLNSFQVVLFLFFVLSTMPCSSAFVPLTKWMGLTNKSLRPMFQTASHYRNFASNNNNAIQSVVICGPSGVGKGTLIAKLLSEHPHRYALSVSHTSRAPRTGEIDHVHYHFISKDEMLADIERGPFKYLEFAHVHGNIYGTREDAVSAIHAQQKVCVLDVDTRGVQQLRSAGFPMRSIFIAPPSEAQLQQRLRSRGTESEAAIQLRTENAKAELKYGLQEGNFDKILVNDDLPRAFDALVRQLNEWFPNTQ